MESTVILKDQFYINGNRLTPFVREALAIEDETKKDGNVTRIVRTFRNRGEAPITFAPCLSVRTENEVKEWFMPCVSYSGNAFGDGMDPKGLLCEGEPWIIPSDHMGIPGCTAVMGDHGCTALFLSPEAVKSAASLEIDGKTVIQRVFFTHIEYPKAYLEKFRYGDAIVNETTLAPNESISFHAYFFAGNESGTFGYRPVIEYLLNNWARKPVDRYTPRIYEDSMSFLRRLVEHREDGVLTNMGFYPRPDKKDPAVPHSEFAYRRSGRYECGWCGQNISNAFLFLFEAMKKEITQKTALAPFDLAFAVEGSFDTGAEDFKNAIAILDTWKKYRFENGLFPVLLDHIYRGKTEEFVLDLCNLGWLSYQYLNCYTLLRNGGVERRDYLECALGVLDALLPTVALGQGFPQTVNEKGEILCPLGMAGTMMTVAALQAYRVTGDEKYLRAGKESFDFYYENYLSKNAAAGGALDTYCIDKESAGPVLRAALMLERITGDRSYLEKAENIACYLQTWMFYYDIPFPEGTDAHTLGFTTFGATAVSAQHHHLDCWASYYVPDLRYLSKLTGNDTWHLASEALREYTFGEISDGKTYLHGLLRPAGAQNEAIFQSNWSFDGNHRKGEFNDWLVCWVCTFRLLDIDHDRACEMQKRAFS